MLREKIMNAKRLIAITLLCFTSQCAFGQDMQGQFPHDLWDSLLDRFVHPENNGRASRVDYAALKGQRQELKAYLDSLAVVTRSDFDSWSQDEQLAFLINAYNAWTVELILSEYPGIDSIRDIGFLPGAPWRKDIVFLFGQQVSLDDVEHGMIRGWDRYQEPRIHFAVNCAAVGCPALSNEAYTGARLQTQLERNTRLFLEDRSRNYVDGSRLMVSPIFRWYGEDFERGWMGYDSVAEFLSAYAAALGLTDAQEQRLINGDLGIRFARYDWRLNSVD
jgi:hypothetical protein